jgi:hypothetical protein
MFLSLPGLQMMIEGLRRRPPRGDNEILPHRAGSFQREYWNICPGFGHPPLERYFFLAIYLAVLLAATFLTVRVRDVTS